MSYRLAFLGQRRVATDIGAVRQDELGTRSRGARVLGRLLVRFQTETLVPNAVEAE